MWLKFVNWVLSYHNSVTGVYIFFLCFSESFCITSQIDAFSPEPQGLDLLLSGSLLLWIFRPWGYRRLQLPSSCLPRIIPLPVFRVTPIKMTSRLLLFILTNIFLLPEVEQWRGERTWRFLVPTWEWTASGPTVLENTLWAAVLDSGFLKWANVALFQLGKMTLAAILY